MSEEKFALSPSGRTLRVTVTLLAAVLLLLGTLWGQDDAFPFGPFRMYSTTDRLNAPVRDTRVDGTDTSGRTFALTEANTGFRRAEAEGQVDRFTADPTLLRWIAEAYTRKNPHAAPVTRIAVVITWHALKDGRPTGETSEETIVTWGK